MTVPPPDFDTAFQGKLAELFAWRRDVRHFRRDPVEPALIQHLLEVAALAPSVGNSQPWRFVLVEDPTRRQKVITNFEHENAEALGDYHGEQAKLYASLKLAGLRDAPVHLAVFCDEGTGQGHGLGRRTMPEMLDYSSVMAVYGFWLAARSHGLGAGWVSILDPAKACRDLEVPEEWRLIAYLCVGWPQEQTDEPELERRGWEHRRPAGEFIVRR